MLADGERNSTLVETLFYAPKGLFGVFYWYLFYPLHIMVFSGLLLKLARLAEESEERR